MSDVKMPTAEQIRDAATCPQAKAALEKLFPDVFKEKLEKIDTKEIFIEQGTASAGFWLRLYDGENPMCNIDSRGAYVVSVNYKVEILGNNNWEFYRKIK